MAKGNNGGRGKPRARYAPGRVSEEARQRQSEGQKRAWADPVKRAARLEAHREAMKRRAIHAGRDERILSQYETTHIYTRANGDILASIPHDPMEYFIFDEPRTEEDYAEA